MLKIQIMVRSVIALVLSATLFAATSSLAQQQTSQIDKPAIYQIGEYLHINASGPRSLLQAVEAVQQKFGWAVDYEDPQYIVAPENPAARPSPPHRLRSMAQTGNANGGFSLQFQLGANPNAAPDEQKLLAALVDAFNQSSSSAQFKLLPQKNGGFAIVGVEAQGANGQMVAQQPLLDLPITLSRRQRSAADAIAAIARELSQQSKLPVSTHLADNVSGSASAVIGGNAAPARELLAQALAALGGQAYWQLLYNADSKSYELNIKLAP